ncbi:GCP1 [Blepharisma stoltei]|uniref:Gcp-like domain-containing protein n=1 Tax=Blepharisma stoltei TaxID=1481888 RepID=A0AAU9JH31_9CILI|nr:unnamed protein product [Blepharisma stoltei]
MKNTPSLILSCTSNQTELILSKSFNNYTILGISIDMNLGKVYQRLSSISGMNYKKIENAVMHEFIDIPVPMKDHKGFDFSFSGPYHRTLQHIYPSVTGIKKIPYIEPLFRLENHEGISSLLASFQVSVIDQLERRISKAIEWSIKENPGVNTLGFCGGVANNYKIAESLRKVCGKYGWTLKVPAFPSTNVYHMKNCLELMKISGYNFDMRRVDIKCYENYPLGPFLFSNN